MPSLLPKPDGRPFHLVVPSPWRWNGDRVCPCSSGATTAPLSPHPDASLLDGASLLVTVKLAASRNVTRWLALECVPSSGAPWTQEVPAPMTTTPSIHPHQGSLPLHVDFRTVISLTLTAVLSGITVGLTVAAALNAQFENLRKEIAASNRAVQAEVAANNRALNGRVDSLYNASLP